MRQPRSIGPLVLTAPAAVGLLLFFVAPLVAFGVYSFLTGSLYDVASPLTLDNYKEVAETDVNRRLARNSLVVGCPRGVLLGADRAPDGLLAALLRGALARDRAVPDRRVVPGLATWCASSPGARCSDATAPSTAASSGSALIDEPLDFLLYNRFAVTIALVHIFLPYVVLVLYAGLAPLQPSYLETAQDLGAGRLQRWRRVVLPLVAAPAVSAFLFVFVLSAADYVTPQLLGGHERVMLGVQVQVAFIGTGDFAYGAAHRVRDAGGLPRLLRAAGPGPAPDEARPGEVRGVTGTRRSPLTGAFTVAGLVFLWAPLLLVVAVQLPLDRLAHVPLRGLLHALVRRGLLFGGDPHRGAEQPDRGDLHRADHAASRDARRLRPDPLEVARCAARCRCCSSSRSRCRACSSGSRCSWPSRASSARSRWSTVTIAHLVYVFPFFFLIARAALERLDPALEETAADLGAGPLDGVPPRDAAAGLARAGGRGLSRVRALLRRVRDHLLRDRSRFDAAALHLVEPAAHDRPEHQRDLHTAARRSRCCCS